MNKGQNRRGSLFFLLVLSSIGLFAQGKITREQYIENYSDIAMREMARTGIPASITLAQACLESDNGNSRLALEGRNHFGIKCHDWDGKEIYHDDDEKDECFRKYKTVEESFYDHSEFLTTKSRYESLFELREDDYKAWARGLKKAGYATSSKYADLLIHIIEENELFRYDRMVLAGSKERRNKPDTEKQFAETRELFTNNRVEYILTREGDTPLLLREEMHLYPWELYRYNDLERGVSLEPGMVLYMQPKRCRAERGKETHEILEEETMWEISQRYGIKLNRLYRINNLEEGIEPESGTILSLRKRVKKEKEYSLQPSKPQQDGEVKMEMEFDEF